MTTYTRDADCLFCKILDGDVPSAKVYEDEHTYAFLDINPVNPGHTLVIPQNHHRTNLETPDSELGTLMTTVKKIGTAFRTALHTDGITTIINTEPAGGQVVFHTHIHVIPRFENDHKSNGWVHTTYAHDQERDTFAEKLRNACTVT